MSAIIIEKSWPGRYVRLYAAYAGVAVTVACPSVMATTMVSQMAVSLTIAESCSVRAHDFEVSVTCLHQSWSRIIYGRPFAVVHDASGTATSRGSDVTIEIAF
ncbi:hypothetical protein AXG89_27845 (plasmid) [Burkholderia sp. PAMC 26561]|nr:hypothetical protein AXG89_24850 [Burkholderia sp. PAMC 26561]AME27696.1 hypothetical protein AXG89_27845 [Burkholderia sp. PAMC 26561]